jgi:hypothetical protein
MDSDPVHSNYEKDIAVQRCRQEVGWFPKLILLKYGINLDF